MHQPLSLVCALFQFTHPGGVRRRLSRQPSGCTWVSIHAPGRGATNNLIMRRTHSVSFNSRTREGCDSLIIASPKTGRCFNSRTREGCDTAGVTAGVSTQCFNSRTREGCDAVRRSVTAFCSCFNSRTREGCDEALLDERAVVVEVSIHAPGRGATR